MIPKGRKKGSKPRSSVKYNIDQTVRESGVCWYKGEEVNGRKRGRERANQ
jgi:hypothetical protein